MFSHRAIMGFERPRTHIPMDSLVILIYEICYCNFKWERIICIRMLGLLSHYYMRLVFHYHCHLILLNIEILLCYFHGRSKMILFLLFFYEVLPSLHMEQKMVHINNFLHL